MTLIPDDASGLAHGGCICGGENLAYRCVLPDPLCKCSTLWRLREYFGGYVLLFFWHDSRIGAKCNYDHTPGTRVVGISEVRGHEMVPRGWFRDLK